MKAQLDSYQCSVLCIIFLAVSVDCLTKIQEKNDTSTKHNFMNFFGQTLISKKKIISTDNKLYIINEFSKLLRISTISKKEIVPLQKIPWKSKNIDFGNPQSRKSGA